MADFSLRVLPPSLHHPLFCQAQSEAHGPPSAMAVRKTSVEADIYMVAAEPYVLLAVQTSLVQV